MAYDWTKQHSSLGGVTLTMEDGSTLHLQDVEWLAELVEAARMSAGRRRPYRPELHLGSG